jgi:hypothetical protein
MQIAKFDPIHDGLWVGLPSNTLRCKTGILNRDWRQYRDERPATRNSPTERY